MSRQPPNFAGHCHVAVWGCGANCGAAAIVNLLTGRVLPPPISDNGPGWSYWILGGGMFGDAGVYSRPDSRLLVIRFGRTYIERLDEVVPDAYYYV